MCFFSSSSWIMGLASSPSKLSRSLNLPEIVSQSSKVYVIIDASLRSSSLILALNS